MVFKTIKILKNGGGPGVWQIWFNNVSMPDKPTKRLQGVLLIYTAASHINSHPRLSSPTCKLLPILHLILWCCPIIFCPIIIFFVFLLFSSYHFPIIIFPLLFVLLFFCTFLCFLLLLVLLLFVLSLFELLLFVLFLIIIPCPIMHLTLWFCPG